MTDWSVADLRFCVAVCRLYVAVRRPLPGLYCVTINVCMVRAAMRRIVPGKLTTTGRLCGQHNNVSLPEEFVEECFDRLQFAYSVVLTILKHGC